MPTIQYPTNPNSDTAFVVQDDGTKNRALMTAPQDTSTLELPSNSNSTKGYVTVDGKKQRVILTADITGGGGGGGSVDYAKTVQRAETMPTADSSNAGQQFLYSGESDATYTHGYIYENVPTTTSSSATAAQTVGSTLSDIAVDLATLESFTGWTTDNSLQIFYTDDGWSVDTTSLGVTYTGTPNVGDAITITYTAAVTTYAWTRVDVQPAPESLPDQTGQNGKFLTTNGTSASWGTVESLPSQTGQNGKFLTTDGTDASWSDKPLVNTAAGTNSYVIGGSNSLNMGNNDVVIGADTISRLGGNNVYLGKGTNSISAFGEKNVAAGSGATTNGNGNVSVGYLATAANGSVQIAMNNASLKTNSDANTVKVANANGNFEMMSADGTVPADRLTKAINKYSTMPTAASTNEGWIVQYTGATDATYTHGYIYECVSDGGNPATYSWSAVQVQAGGGGGSLPSQSGHSGEFLTTDGTDASWATISALQNTATGTDSIAIGVATSLNRSVTVGTLASGNSTNGVAIGYSAKVSNTGTIAIGYNAGASGNGSIAIGRSADIDVFPVAAGTIQLGEGTNTLGGSFQVKTHTLLTSAGLIPADRLADTTGLADGNYRLRLTMASGVPTLSWVAE